MDLSDITFVPKGDFSGTAVITYTGYADATSFFQGTIFFLISHRISLYGEIFLTHWQTIWKACRK